MVYLIINFLIISVDQLTKRLVKKKLGINEKHEVIKNRFYIWHKQNTGLAFSVFSGHIKAISTATAVLTVIGYILFIIMLPVKGIKSLKTGFSFLLAGAAGNLIDRLRDMEVTDFLYIKAKSAPIFNIADIFLIIGSVISALSLKSE